MTELLLIACIAATTYYLMRWCQTGRYMHLAATAAAAFLATLTRYEGWVLCAAVMAIVVYVAWRRPAPAQIPGRAEAAGGAWRRWWWRVRVTRSRLQAVEANAIFYGCLGLSGIAGWVLWNTVIFRDPFYFQTGQFAKPSLWVSHSEHAIGHWGVSAMTYMYAMADNASFSALALAAMGFGLLPGPDPAAGRLHRPAGADRVPALLRLRPLFRPASAARHADHGGICTTSGSGS